MSLGLMSATGVAPRGFVITSGVAWVETACGAFDIAGRRRTRPQLISVTAFVCWVVAGLSGRCMLATLDLVPY